MRALLILPKIADHLCLIDQFDYRLMFSANRAIFLLMELYLSEIHGFGVKGKQGVSEEFSYFRDKF